MIPELIKKLDAIETIKKTRCDPNQKENQKLSKLVRNLDAIKTRKKTRWEPNNKKTRCYTI